MAPTEHTFPVSSLPSQVHSTTKNFKTKSRKLPTDFDLQRACELFEVVQYSCTSEKEMRDAVLRNPNAKPLPMECFPFVRLFRRCGQRDGSVFHVETTAWEGQYKWEAPTKRILEEATTLHDDAKEKGRGRWSWWSG
ncbi:uncharacterized protein AB675_8300 [Cyphellophora attinorum]|uniref:Uncharacterized protein n=1 Tax=Cyphellophora attinorum TaxID=1664694 RepID=A0A0N0NQR4_9EURO|nr:uncharacterized protein AB675_8300 [Phialophora attinorum]KPI44221.1 hypothetical protein AB675_8300 [Phialophora attinorum]